MQAGCSPQLPAVFDSSRDEDEAGAGAGAVGSSGWCRVLGRGESHAAVSPAVTELSFFSLVNLAVSTSQADLKRASLPCLKVPAKHLALKDRI